MVKFRQFGTAAILVSAWLTAHAQPGTGHLSTIKPDRATIARQYGKLPLRFETNQGQVPSDADFVARGPGYDMILNATGASLRLRHLRDSKTRSATEESFRMKLVGAAQPARVEALDPIETQTSYFIGNDPAKWRTGIRNYGSVWYRGVYPGVDLNYHGNQGQLEYDFVLDKGADASRIVLEFDGIAKLDIDRDGDLILHVGEGEIRQHQPVFYQQSGGSRTPVSGRYKLLGHNRVGFEVAAYDHNLPLVIDPTLSYSTYVGGNGWDEGVGIALDGAGNAYVAGWTTSTNFPVTAGAKQTAFAGGATYGDAFVFKLNASGTGLVYCTYLGGASDDVGWMIAVDSAGNAYVTGNTSSIDFPTTVGAFQRTLTGTTAAFVSKLNATGTGLVYSTYLGGSAIDKGLGVAVDASGVAYVAGRATSSNFPTTAGAFRTTNAGSDDVFVAKVNASGSGLVYSTLIGGAGIDLANGIAVDSSGSAYVSGYTQSANFPVTAGALQTVFTGTPGNAFVTKLNLTGTALVYSTFLGGNGDEYVRSIALDSLGNAYVAGRTGSTNFPVTAGAFQTVYRGSNDGFVSKLNQSGTALVYSTYLGGTGTDQFESIAVDSTGAAHVVGLSTSADYPVTADALQPALRGAQNSVLSKLNSTGTGLLFSTYFGGSGGTDTAIFVATDSANATYLMGFTNSADLFTTSGAFSRTFGGGIGDTFVVKVDYSVSCTYSLSPISQSVPAAGGNTSTNITTGAGCPWTAASGVPWVSVTSGSSGVGNGTTVLTVSANTGLARSGSVTIAGQTFTVNQAASSGGFTPIRVNAGGNAYTDPQGQVWSADTGFSGGFTFSNSNTISNTTTPPLYQDERASSTTFQYQFAVPNATYNVNLKFAEIYFTQAGQRSFNVVINGQQVLTNFDVVAAAGGANTAVDKVFPIPVTTGQITIQFVPVVSTPTISAIEILAAPGVSVTVSPANVTLTPNAQQIFTATVTGSSNQAVNWALTGPGTLAGSTYTAPSIVTVGQTATVTATSQADATAKGTGTVSFAQCTYSINPTSQSFTSTGGPGSVTVTAAAGCSWTAASNAAWVTITSGASGSGNGTVSYTVATTTVGRSGTVTVAGQTFTINQSAPSCTYTINPTSQSFNSTGGPGSVAVTAAAGCSWTAASNVAWVTITSGASGSGNGSVSYTVAATTVGRSGTVTIAGQTFTINQTAPSCTYSINPTSQTFSSTGGPGSVAVTASAGCSWTATSNVAWVTITSGASGSGNGTVSYTVATSTVGRSGTMTIAGQTFTLNQTAPGFTPIRVNTGGGAYTDPQGQVWSADTGFSGGFTYGNSDTILNTTTPPLYQDERASSTTFQYQFAVPNGTYNVKLKFAEIYFTQTGQRSFNVVINGQQVLTNFDVVVAAGGADTAVDKVFPVSVTAGQITIQFVPVVSSPTISAIEILGASSVSVAVSPANVTLTPNAQQIFTATVTGSSNQAVNWSLSGPGTLAGNTYTAPSIFTAGQTATVTATSQADATATGTGTVAFAPGCTYSINPTSQSFTSTGGSGSVAVTAAAGCNWTATSNAAWVTITSGASGSGNGSVNYTVATTTAGRSGTVTIAGQTFTLNQTAPGFTPIRVNTGGGAYTDPLGQVWSADTGFSGGFTFGNSDTISNTTTPALYQDERASSTTFQYQFAVPNGTYNVKLKFAEIYFTQTGQRSFNVVINGQQVLTNFDVVAAAGGADTAVDQVFPISVTAGQITIQFVPVVSTPTISAIEIQ